LATKYWCRRYMETERTMVSSAVENGRWKRAIGLRKSM
jgi:hypothetical protein